MLLANTVDQDMVDAHQLPSPPAIMRAGILLLVAIHGAWLTAELSAACPRLVTLLCLCCSQPIGRCAACHCAVPAACDAAGKGARGWSVACRLKCPDRG